MDNRLKQGEALFSGGKIVEAQKCFLEVLDHDPQNKEAYNNLGVISIKNQQIEEAIDYFNKSLTLDPFYKQGALNLVFVLKELNMADKAIPYFETLLEEYPEDEELNQIMKEIRVVQQPRKKIAILCLPGLQSFIGDIANFLETDYEVISCVSDNNQEIESSIAQADIIWLEWANELAISVTNHPTLLDNKYVICRLHSYEALADYPGKINWTKVDDLIFVSEHIKDIVLQSFPDINDKVKRMHIVPNGVNLDNFPFKKRRPEYNLAFVGNINFKKGPMLLLHAFRELVEVDNRYRLFIAGSFQDIRYNLYFSQMIKELGLEQNIQIDGWVENVSSWLEDKQYIICSSVLEGHPVSLMEAMACGIKPLIHNYVGAKYSYPDKYIWNSIPDFTSMVINDDYNSEEYRSFIEHRYSLNNQLNKIDSLFNSIRSSNDLKLSLNPVLAVNFSGQNKDCLSA